MVVLWLAVCSTARTAASIEENRTTPWVSGSYSSGLYDWELSSSFFDGEAVTLLVPIR